MSATAAPALRDALKGATCYALAALLATATILLATGLREGGFAHPRVTRLGRGFGDWLPYGVVAAAALGALMPRFHRGWMGLRAGQAPSGRIAFLAVVRAFAVFPLYGLLALFAMLLDLGRRLLFGLAFAVRPGPVVHPMPSFAHTMANLVPLWFVLAPLQHLDRLRKTPPPSQALPAMRSRAIRFLPFVFLGLGLWTGARSEQTGRRVDPYWSSAGATYWLGDYLLSLVRQQASELLPAVAGRQRLRTGRIGAQGVGHGLQGLVVVSAEPRIAPAGGASLHPRPRAATLNSLSWTYSGVSEGATHEGRLPFWQARRRRGSEARAQGGPEHNGRRYCQVVQ